MQLQYNATHFADLRNKVELAVQMVTKGLIQAQSEIRPLHKGS